MVSDQEQCCVVCGVMLCDGFGDCGGGVDDEDVLYVYFVIWCQKLDEKCGLMNWLKFCQCGYVCWNEVVVICVFLVGYWVLFVVLMIWFRCCSSVYNVLLVLGKFRVRVVFGCGKDNMLSDGCVLNCLSIVRNEFWLLWVIFCNRVGILFVVVCGGSMYWYCMKLVGLYIWFYWLMLLSGQKKGSR